MKHTLDKQVLLNTTKGFFGRHNHGDRPLEEVSAVRLRHDEKSYRDHMFAGIAKKKQE